MNKNNKLGLILSLLISVGSTSALAGIDDELKNVWTSLGGQSLSNSAG